MKEYNFLAFDIGATSGRAMLGIWRGDHFYLNEIHRFENPMVHLHGCLYWDIYALYNSIVESLRICAIEGINLTSIGIDTWGVDYGWINEDGMLLSLPACYRDSRNNSACEEFLKLYSREELYMRTGIQLLPFNTIFQLYREMGDYSSVRPVGGRLLFIPDLLIYMLTRRMVCEYTIASTSQLLNMYNGSFDYELLNLVGLRGDSMAGIVMPGTMVGVVSDEISRRCGVGKIPVIAVAGHDTASAVAAVPSTSNDFAYLSSGTWSLMGIEVDSPIINDESMRNNFTNEGGIEGTTRFLKNITGMWLLERCRKVWKSEHKSYGYGEIMDMARRSSFASLINPDDHRFANPDNMVDEIYKYCVEHGEEPPASDADVVRCIFLSLANRYAEVLGMLREISPQPINRLHVIGGGAKNSLLNQLTADAIGIPVVAGPAEATSIGNCMIQAKAAGLFANRWEMRDSIARTFGTELFEPSRY